MPSLQLSRVQIALLLLVPLLLAAAIWPLAGRTPAVPTEGAEVEASAPLPTVLVEAATGDALEDMTAVGQNAELINASLPFSDGPNPAARGFAGAAPGSLAYDRAHLCLTQAIYYEAGFEPEQGRRAVAQVVLNRVKHPTFPASVCGVVYEGAKRPVCQFSFTCDGSLNRRPAQAAWNRAKQLAADALAGRVEPSVGMATHYHADYVAPRWAPMLAKTTKIGQHIFYRWPGNFGRPAAFTEAYAGEPHAASALRPTVLPTGEEDEMALDDYAAVAPEPFPTRAEDPTIRRAENDIGGLVDTTRGWTPSIPLPQGLRDREQVARAEPVATIPQGAE